MDDISDKALKGMVFNFHKLTGLTILFLMIFRLIWTLTNPKPDLPAGTPEWQKWAEWIVQGSIYLALIAMPIAGWLMTALMVSFGAPFWYSLIGKIANNRAAGSKPESAV